MDQRKVLVVIPAFNEQEAIGAVLDDLGKHGPDLDVLVVDDGSIDSTADVAKLHGAEVLRLPFNLGIGGALRTGFRYAVRNGYSVAVQFDADGQHDATQVKVILDALGSGADLVIGSRFASNDSSYEVGRVRSGAMRLLRLAFAVILGHRFTDTSSGFRAFSRPMLEYFSRRYPVEYMDSTEALLIACYAGFKVIEVPTTMRQRIAGTASNGSVKLAYHYLRLLLVVVTSISLRGRKARSES